jgi:tetratricopeptide (TPR) repeat protein
MMIQNKKVLFFITVFFIFFSYVNLFSYSPEVIRYFSSLKSKEPLELIESIEKQIGQEEKLNTHPEKTKELYYLLAEVQEKMGDYEEASKNYEKVASQEAFLAAAKTALLYGDSLRCDTLLSRLTQGHIKEKLVSQVRLYAVWSWLVKAQSEDALHEPLVILKSYVGMKGMEEEQAAILLTLWYLTGEEAYKVAIEKQYPKSLEFLVLESAASFLPTPFWFFVPRKNQG